MPAAGRALDHAAASHVLRRAGFGAPSEGVESAARRGLDDTLDDLLARRSHPAALTDGVDALLSGQDPTKLQAWWMALILGDHAPLLERVTLMWHGHFATSIAKVGDVRLMHRQNELFRHLGLGDFRELLHATARDPAMLLWLDGDQNRVGQPNENFARELLELFALGRDAGYTERDVTEAARAFSGWGVERREFVFRADRHDHGEKSLLGSGGVSTGEEALDRVLAHPDCPRWVARRLLVTFCAPDPAAALCAEWGAVLVEEGWRIDRTLARLLRSEHFLGPAARRSRIASPVELVASTALALRIRIPPLDAVRAAGVMGQTLCMPPTVKGWDGGRAWIDAGTWLARHNTLAELVLTGERFEPARALGGEAERDDVVPRLAQALLPDGVDPALRAVLEDTARRARSVESAARDVAALLLTAPEFHLA